MEPQTAEEVRQRAYENERRKRLQRLIPKRVIEIVEAAPNPVPIPVVVIEPLPPQPPSNAFMMARIRIAVCRDFNVTREEFLSHRRPTHFALARHVAFYLASRLTKLSLPKIGVIAGGRDHTTVLHGIRRIQRLVETCPELAAQIAALEEELRG